MSTIFSLLLLAVVASAGFIRQQDICTISANELQGKISDVIRQSQASRRLCAKSSGCVIAKNDSNSLVQISNNWSELDIELNPICASYNATTCPATLRMSIGNEIVFSDIDYTHTCRPANCGDQPFESYIRSRVISHGLDQVHWYLPAGDNIEATDMIIRCNQEAANCFFDIEYCTTTIRLSRTEIRTMSTLSEYPTASKSTCSCSTDQLAEDAPEGDDSASLGRQDADQDSATQIRESDDEYMTSVSWIGVGIATAVVALAIIGAILHQKRRTMPFRNLYV